MLNDWWLQLLDADGSTRPDYGGETGSGLNPDGVWIVENDGSANYLVAGESYSVIEIMQTGWVSSRDEMTITIKSLPVGISSYWMPNYRPASIKVCKFNDVNGNGVQDDGEPMLQGWTFELTQNGWTSPETVLTDEVGCATFENLRPGTYSVSEVQQVDWQQTMPDGEFLTVTVESGEMAESSDDGKPLLFGNHTSPTSVKLNGFDAQGAATVWFSSLGALLAVAVTLVINRDR